MAEGVDGDIGRAEWVVTVRADAPETASPAASDGLVALMWPLLKEMKSYGPVGRIEHNGRWYEATLVVSTPSESDAWFEALDAVTTARTAVGLPLWPLRIVPELTYAVGPRPPGAPRTLGEIRRRGQAGS